MVTAITKPLPIKPRSLTLGKITTITKPLPIKPCFTRYSSPNKIISPYRPFALRKILSQLRKDCRVNLRNSNHAQKWALSNGPNVAEQVACDV